jgi:predicted TIM-barrel fold metal-dependent hydrolase
VFCDDPLLEHMDALAALANRFPGVTICVDHAGFPRERGAEYFKRWREHMKRLAHGENTVVKISGLGMCDHEWGVESLRPWVLACIDLWGPRRAFFGSNWPVDRLYSSYGDVIEAYAEIASGFLRSWRTPNSPQRPERRPVPPPPGAADRSRLPRHSRAGRT